MSAPSPGGGRGGGPEVRRRRGGEQPMVPEAAFSSYYGRPVIHEPVWRSPEVPGYLFLGGLAGTSSVLAAGASLTGRPGLRRSAALGAAGAIALSGVALVADLGRPERFANMLRVFKVTSPMSVGSWLLSVYGPAAGFAALADLTGTLPRARRAVTLAAGALGPAVATYTAVLLADTAVPAWHEGYRELPFVFAGSAATAGAGLALLVAPRRENAPARRLALAGTLCELVAAHLMVHRLGLVAEPYRNARPGRLMRQGEALTVTGLAVSLLAGRSRTLGALAGAALLGASACTRFGIFEAGMTSARDPRDTVVPQRERRERRALGAPARDRTR